MENKKTAVEWLIEQIEEGKIEIVYSDKVHSIKCLNFVVEQAKAMEKEQIADAIDFGFIDDGDFRGIDYFYELRFNGGKNICPNCKQGILRLDRPGKMGCSVC